MHADLLQLEDELDELLHDYGYQLVDLQLARSGSRGVFRVFIDRVDRQPVTLDDCCAVSPQVQLFLEMKSLYTERTSLEVSSAGVNRVLKRNRDFERFLGERVKATYFEGRHRATIVGELSSFNDDVLVITPDEAAEPPEALTIRREDLTQVNVVPQLEI